MAPGANCHASTVSEHDVPFPTVHARIVPTPETTTEINPELALTPACVALTRRFRRIPVVALYRVHGLIVNPALVHAPGHGDR